MAYLDKEFLDFLTPKLTAGQTWLVTGAAGFIGSNLVEALLCLGQRVRGLDNFATGFRSNLKDVERVVGAESWRRFELIEGDICNLQTCMEATEGVDFVLHQAALGSVPRSIKAPSVSTDSNVSGMVKMMEASVQAKVKKFVYASSSSVYGDNVDMPKIETRTGSPLSPYAVTKVCDEIFAKVFHRCYQLPTVGLRYFNVFGKRQNPNGPYAAVIPRWIKAAESQDRIEIFGDGETSRDFCFVENVVQANILAALADRSECGGEVFNVALGDTTRLTELAEMIVGLVSESSNMGVQSKASTIEYRPFRDGDIRHSMADISKANTILKYAPKYRIEQGLREYVAWRRSSDHQFV
jgi:UDP-N-acetylglucosamine 4-epimerase